MKACFLKTDTYQFPAIFSLFLTSFPYFSLHIDTLNIRVLFSIIFQYTINIHLMQSVSWYAENMPQTVLLVFFSSVRFIDLFIPLITQD